MCHKLLILYKSDLTKEKIMDIMKIIDWFEDLAEAIIISDYEYEYNMIYANNNENINYNYKNYHGAISIK